MYSVEQEICVLWLRLEHAVMERNPEHLTIRNHSQGQCQHASAEGSTALDHTEPRAKVWPIKDAAYCVSSSQSRACLPLKNILGRILNDGGICHLPAASL
jgi:hypothetical protein